jgi:hypothetical protein
MLLKKFTTLALVSAATGLAALGAAPLAFAMDEPVPFGADTMPELMMHQDPNEFVLPAGRMKTVAETFKTKTYRVCVASPDKFAGGKAIPVLVESENGQQVIKPGECANVDGKVIRMAPHGHLAYGEELVGHHRELG